MWLTGRRLGNLCSSPVGRGIVLHHFLKAQAFHSLNFDTASCFPAPCFYFCFLSMALHHQVALPQRQQGREGEQPCVSQVPGLWPTGMLQEQCELFPFPGRPAHHLCHVLKLHWPKAWDESSRGESIRRQSQGCAEGNPISSGLFIS